MPPPTSFPGSGPDQTLFMLLFALGFAIGVLGYLSGSRTLRLAGILMVFVATAIFLGDVFSSSTL